MDNSYYGKERSGIIGEADAILNKDKLHPDLGAGDVAIFSSIINDEARIEVEGSNPDMILGATAAQIGIQSMISEPVTGIADLSFSTNASADGYLTGKEITGEIGFLAINDNANPHDNLGLIPGIENANCSIGVCGDLLFDESNNDLLSLDSQGVTISKSIYETGSLASFNEGVLIDPSLGYADGRIEFLAADASLGDISSGTRLTNGASFLGTSGNTFLGVGMDSNYELGAINQVGVSNIQAENNFNLIDADLGIAIAAYKPSGMLNGANHTQTVDFLSMESEDEFDTVLLEQPYFEGEKYKELKNIYSQFQNSIDSGNISHFMQYAEVGNKTIKIYCMNLNINIDGDLIGSYHIGNNYTLKIESNE